MKIQSSVSSISRLLMISTVVLISAFQCYWINRLYTDEFQNLQRETDVLFRDVIYNLQVQRFKNDTTFFKKGMPDNLFVFNLIDSVKEDLVPGDSTNYMATTQRQLRISVAANPRQKPGVKDIETIRHYADSMMLPVPPNGAPRLMKFFSADKNLNDSLSLSKIAAAYKASLKKNDITISFTIKQFTGKENNTNNAAHTDKLETNLTYVGLAQTHAYQAIFAIPFGYIFGKVKLQILLSLLLLTITIVSFVFLYRNLIAQRRIAVIKNEFISNITHELKTPIATMTVAIEALRNFNALQSPEKTKEYLDISAAKLQRLSLLADNVLRLSMLENKAIILNKERFDLYSLSEEIIDTMKLQFDKANAVVHLYKEGDTFIIEADRLHITSVIYNLLDNALKYSTESPLIQVKIIAHPGYMELLVKDNGIGIAKEYRQKIFDKFFRVPSNNIHNIKGYGLGLSYVNHIARLHQGFIEVESEPGKGSVFSVKLPYEEKPIIHYDKGRVIRKI